MKQILFSSLFFFALLTAAQAQNTLVRHYGTQRYMKSVVAADPNVSKAQANIERYTQDFKSKTQSDTVTIPLVFHIVYSGTTAPVTLADVQAQVARLNLDFFTLDHDYALQKTAYEDDFEPSEKYPENSSLTSGSLVYKHQADRYAGFATKAARPNVRFCLPTDIPAVRFVSSATTVWEMGKDLMKSSENGGSSPVEPARYCNVWVVRLPDDLSGYAIMPGGPSQLDGIVIDDRFFAKSAPAVLNPYSLGRTLVHLMGSYLNVYELWNETRPCSDDYADDTPIHNAPNYGKPRYKQISTCFGNPIEMTTNLMDNTDDAAQYIFTTGQVQRMQATLSPDGPRGKLREPMANCSATPFTDANDRTEAGGNVVASYNQPMRLQIFPNPASKGFQVNIASNCGLEMQVAVFGTDGKQMAKIMASSDDKGRASVYLTTTGWPTGVYNVRVSCDHEQAMSRVVVE